MDGVAFGNAGPGPAGSSSVDGGTVVSEEVDFSEFIDQIKDCEQSLSERLLAF